MKLRTAQMEAAARLARRHVESSQLEAEVLLRHVLGMDRATFFASLERDLTPEQQRQFGNLVNLRLQGEPLAYITGHREFYGLDFVVNHHVLVPRQETELLVEMALGFAASRAGQPLTVADIGVGSGAVAVAIARNLPYALVYGTDTSREALAVAEENARRHGLAGRVRLLHGDLCEPLPEPVDIIVSNPPYIPSKQLSRLAPEIQREPREALDGGPGGLTHIERLLRQSPQYVNTGGLIAIEMMPEQIEQAMSIAQEAFPAAQVSFERDLLKLPRALRIERLHIE